MQILRGRMNWVLPTALCLAACALGVGDALAKEDWQPAKTWLFAVGVLEFEHADVWPLMLGAKQGRRDVTLVELFRQAGVPPEQVTYLQDRAATHQNIRQNYIGQLSRTRPGDLLVLYYTGHGSRNRENGKTCFATYDAGQKYASAWPVALMFQDLEEYFRGDRVLIMADCCYSGALVDEARRHKTRLAISVLSSSYSHNSSTGNWTFSDALLAGLQGRPEVDLDGDQQVELHELAEYAELDMAFIEEQKAMFFANDKFQRDMRLKATAGERRPNSGNRVEALWEGKWYKAKTLDVAQGSTRVHYIGYDSTFDEWLTADRVRPYAPSMYQQGTKVEALWNKQWYPAIVQKTWYGLHFIHYDNYSNEWDEWVGRKSLRPSAN
jgi:hypothetical protein